MRSGLLVLIVAVGLAGGFSALASTDTYAPRLMRLEARSALPSIEASLAQESAALNSVFLAYAEDQPLWMSAHLAILRYGDIARAALLEYAALPEFQHVLVRFGPDAVLPISYFRAHDVATLRAQHWVGERYQQLSRWWSEEGEQAQGDAEWTPHRRGQIGIALLDAEGHALLNQFVVDAEGEVHWLQGERVVAGISDFFTSGLRHLENQWRRDEAIGASDIGWAGVDLLLMASTVKVLRAGRLARGARVGSAEAQGVRAGMRQGIAAGAGRFASLPRMAKIAAVTTTAYVVVRHPSLISALGANAAKWLSLPVWLGQFGVWFIVLLPVLMAARFIWRWVMVPLLWLLMPVIRTALNVLDKAHPRKAAGAPDN
ncbi:hypothetical protein B0H98_101189 [Vreelandella songnenensis]|uniref:Uncharacterized protein n=1 Tax=Vreelandella songnenensis TaxID=1176243 RepID=A0A2T0V7U2_9GAMM|nr:hypothetical protein [Halomonas songnenensis]PRY66211.1 hypothetical protein B0H98_101189 [Halomonas songnenensis]